MAVEVDPRALQFDDRQRRSVLRIVSPANKHARRQLDDFVDKIAVALRDGIHVTVVDPLPLGRFDPDGMHGEVWCRLMADEFHPPPGKPLTLFSYAVRRPVTVR